LLLDETEQKSKGLLTRPFTKPFSEEEDQEYNGDESLITIAEIASDASLMIDEEVEIGGMFFDKKSKRSSS
jgi:hypothetical protein